MISVASLAASGILHLPFSILLLAAGAVAAHAAAPASSRDYAEAGWPQAGGGPQRHGYSPDTPKLFSGREDEIRWVVRFEDGTGFERMNAAVQPIVHQGVVYIGTKKGVLHALAGPSLLGHMLSCNSLIAKPTVSKVWSQVRRLFLK